MLSIEAMNLWEHKKSEEYRKKIHYEGIYIPGDLVWGEMLRSLSKAGIEKDCADAFAYTSFCTHIFISVIETMSSSIRIFSEDPDRLIIINERKELIRDAAHDISKLLKLNLDKVSLQRIRNELHFRLQELGEYAQKVKDEKNICLETLRKDLPYSTLNYKNVLESAFVMFDDALDRPEHRWALLFDEFEIAPNFILNSVIESMRSSAKKIIYKVALVPCGEHQNINAQISTNNDHSVVELWYRTKYESREFCNNILKSRFNIANPEDIFGRTKYINNKQSESTDWEPIFLELYEKDPTFREYIDSKKIDIHQSFSIKGNASSDLRKIAPRVAFRNAFLNESGEKKGRKSLHEFYAGWDAITRISEGNPRWLISTLNSLLKNKGDNLLIPQNKQFKQIQTATNAYAAMLRTTALSNNMGISTKQPPFSIIEKIAGYFNYILIKGKFMTDPPITFIVDDNTPPDVELSLRIALNFGAIISLNEEQDLWNFESLYGKRFRLSFLLSPKFDLPLRAEKKVYLSRILSSKEEGPMPQGDFFNAS
jgi:hypothetical protein